jgi:hypothetical protein
MNASRDLSIFHTLEEGVEAEEVVAATLIKKKEMVIPILLRHLQ